MNDWCNIDSIVREYYSQTQKLFAVTHVKFPYLGDLEEEIHLQVNMKWMPGELATGVIDVFDPHRPSPSVEG
jgi:hypothetical protein